jgi:hypothetical protein
MFLFLAALTQKMTVAACPVHVVRGRYGTRATWVVARVVAQNNFIYVVRITDFGLK